MESNGMNWLAVLVAGIAAWALGALWYSPVLFGKAWQKESGLTEENLKNANMPLIFGTSAVMMIIMSAGLAMFFQGDAAMNAMKGLQMGLVTGLVFVATSTAINYLYQRKSFKLWLIDAAYQVLLLALAGAIVGAWR
ncbi:MAG TPA: DUF1761 domain-containing protein [Saprospiraceae bacterium]|nr:DUF1761 domain-containing protein [Saprospiraceae bacterium]HNT18919.1 DUF1761 domain-containing protein [Saprospiraceae bacterium]